MGRNALEGQVTGEALQLYSVLDAGRLVAGKREGALEAGVCHRLVVVGVE